MKRSLSIMTVGAVVLAGGLATMPANADMKDLDYTIDSPYASVDWGWHQYKSGFHNHTTESDGGNTLDLDEYGKDIDNYVRAQLKGDNGISFTNAFGIDFAKKTKNGRFLSDSEAADIALASIDRTTADVHVARDFKGKDKQFVVTITTADGAQTVKVDTETGEIL